jgi:hypothetical protein
VGLALPDVVADKVKADVADELRQSLEEKVATPVVESSAVEDTEGVWDLVMVLLLVDDTLDVAEEERVKFPDEVDMPLKEKQPVEVGDVE